jgi:hypothetical protein
MALAFEHPLGEQAVGVGVIDDQHREGGETEFMVLVIGGCRWSFGGGELHGEMEGAADADFAFDPDAAAHHLDQSADDAEAEACSAIFAGDRTVDLFEGDEDLAEAFGGDADAGIANREEELAGRFAVSDDQRDLAAAGGELEGVAEKVEENLAESPVVAGDPVGESGGGLAFEGQGSFDGPLPQHRE